MKKIEFINDSAPYLSAENLNLLQDNVEESIDEINKVIVSSTEPTTGEEVWIQKGKNYINLEELTNYSLNETTGALEINNTRLVTPYIFLKAGTYTISCNVSRFAYVVYNKDKSFNSFVSWQTFPNKIILNSDCYIRVEIIKDYNGSEVINKTDITYLQLEKGEVATSYEPYTPKKIHTKIDNGYEEFYSEENKEVYSTDEQRIGTWIDGTPLYRTTVFREIAIQKDVTLTIDSGIKNINKIVNVGGIVSSSNKQAYFAINTYNLENNVVSVSVKFEQDGRILIRSTDNWGSPDIIIHLEYTKTTDF